MADIEFDVQLNVRGFSYSDDALNIRETDFYGFGETVIAFGRILHIVVWRTHKTVFPLPQDVRFPDFELVRVEYGSPLRVVATVKHLADAITSETVRLLNEILSRCLYYDLEREHRHLENVSLEADISRKRIENAKELLTLLRDARAEFGIEDVGHLATAIATIQRHGNLDGHRVGRIAGAAVVETDDNKKR